MGKAALHGSGYGGNTSDIVRMFMASKQKKLFAHRSHTSGEIEAFFAEDVVRFVEENQPMTTPRMLVFGAAADNGLPRTGERHDFVGFVEAVDREVVWVQERTLHSVCYGVFPPLEGDRCYAEFTLTREEALRQLLDLNKA